MLPLLRYAKVFLRLGRRPRLAPMQESTIAFRVWPNDLDLNRHLTNSRYFALMDAARYDLVIRSGAWKAWRANGWFPVVASQRIRFRKSLAPGTKYQVRTRILGWDERDLFIAQAFERGGVLHADATVRAAILSKAGRVPVPDVMRASGFDGPSPPLPQRIKAWAQVERSGDA